MTDATKEITHLRWSRLTLRRLATSRLRHALTLGLASTSANGWCYHHGRSRNGGNVHALAALGASAAAPTALAALHAAASLQISVLDALEPIGENTRRPTAPLIVGGNKCNQEDCVD